MLRWLFAIVVLLNVAFLAWSQHWLAPLGLAPVVEGEPERVQQQVRPETLVVRRDVPENLPAPESVVSASAAADQGAASAPAASVPR